jgi:glycosyltransferase involved in cell wall biosynthesis
MKILFLTDNFPPEFNAPATRTYEHCREWVKLGADVTVITCAPNFPSGKVFEGYKNKWKQVELMDGIKVIRVWSFISPNAGFIKRTLDFISFCVTSFLAGLTVKTDLIVATSPQFFTAVSGCALSLLRRKKWVMEVRDIWPESIVAVDAVRSRWIISILEKVELFLYRTAHKIVVVTDAFKVNLISKGVPAEQVHVVKNGVDLSIYQPRPKNEALLRSLNLQNKFVVGYVGTHGLAHSLDFIIRCIDKVQEASFHFIFIGDGAEKKNLLRLAGELKLENVTFLDPVRKSEIANYLSTLDIALVPLKKSTTFQSVIPSKVFESVAMNIPILLGVDGETREIIETYHAGLFFEPENESDFLKKLLAIRSEMENNKEKLFSGCSKMAMDFDRNNLARKMLAVLSD